MLPTRLPMIPICWSYSMLEVKHGAIYISSIPPDPVLTPGMSHEITSFERAGGGGKEEESGRSFKNKYKTQDPRVFPMMHCSLLSAVTRDIVTEAGAEVYFSQAISVRGTHKQRNGSKQWTSTTQAPSPVINSDQGTDERNANLICVSDCGC